MTTHLRRIGLSLTAVLILASTAVAHHGWSWAEAEESVMEATVATVSMAPPHPSLTVTDADGAEWEIELGNPGRVQRAGFTADTLAPGDAVTILGNRSLDQAERVMKAVRITAGGQNYDFYPERIDS